MRLFWICAVSSVACATTTQARPPLRADQVERLNRQVKDRVARVELASNAGAPAALELRRIEFAPEFLRGTAADGPRTVALGEVASLKWRTWEMGALLGLLAGRYGLQQSGIVLHESGVEPAELLHQSWQEMINKRGAMGCI